MLLERAYETLGALSILVNNAAHSGLGSFETLDAEGLDAHYFVNVRAAVLLSVGSGQDLSPMPGELAYVACKAAIAGITQSLAKEVAHKGITVNAVDPGPTQKRLPGGRLQGCKPEAPLTITIPYKADNIVTQAAHSVEQNDRLFHSECEK